MAKKPAKEVQEQTPEPKMGSLFRTGEEGIRHREQLDKATAAKKERSALELWLKAGESANMIFVDDGGVYVYRHGIKANGSFYMMTCSKDFHICPICEDPRFAKSYPSYIAYYTVIDLRSYISKKDGKEVKFTKKLYPAKGSAMQKRIHEFKKRYGSLVGRVFTVTRYAQTESTSGSVIDPAMKEGKEYARVDIAKKLGAEFALPHDYGKVLAEPTPEELAMLGIGAPAMIGSSSIQPPEGTSTVSGEDLNELF